MKGHRVCLYCGSVTRNKLFCGNYCKAKYGKVIYDVKSCKYCDVEFKGDGEFCSIECEQSYLLEHIDELKDLSELERVNELIEEINNFKSDKRRCSYDLNELRCIMCNKKIVNKNKVKRSFCSIKCLNYYKKLPRTIRKRCAVCGKIYHINLYELEHDMRLTCDNCKGYIKKHKLVTIVKKCEKCSNLFSSYDSNSKFCSVDCELGLSIRNRRKYIVKSIRRL